MIEILAVSIMLVYGLLCIRFGVVSHRLGRQFVAKRPDLMAKYLPEAGSGLRHPRKLLFFLTPLAAKVLSDDKDLLRLRNQLVYLVWSIGLYIVLSFLLFVAVVTFMSS